jgi:imidazolonepropionase-like amidohydrolase
MIVIDDVRIAAARTRRLSGPASVAVKEGRIAAVLHGEDERRAARAGAGEVVAGSGMILMPGLVNAHTHSYGNVLRGTRTACRSSRGRSTPSPMAARSTTRRSGSPSCSARPR